MLVWVTAENSSIHHDNPVPLAMLPPGNIFRDYGLAALESIGRTWRFACVSESIGGLQAAVFAGIAVSVVGKSSVLPGMRELGRSRKFPGAAEGRSCASSFGAAAKSGSRSDGKFYCPSLCKFRSGAVIPRR